MSKQVNSPKRQKLANDEAALARHDDESRKAAAHVRYRVEADPGYTGRFMLLDGHKEGREAIKAIGLTPKAARELAARYNRENGK